MNWKKLIFASGGEDDDSVKKSTPVETSKEASPSFQSKFPVTPTAVRNETITMPTSSNPAITPNNPACAPHMEKIMTMYEQGFDSLNQAGYDFYEYFKSVVEGGVNNPTVYTMAFTMGKAMDKNLTKASLLSQSEFYISEIRKVHQQYVDAGNQKRQQAITSKTQEETTLNTDIRDIDVELNRLMTLKSQKQAELAKIDGKYQPQITEVECKLMANDVAMEGIVGSIQKVVQGINNNI